jgi:hypothetical protein
MWRQWQMKQQFWRPCSVKLEEFLNEVEKLISLVLCLPISVAGFGRAFSLLRILKTWLRSTSTQERLTHLARLLNAFAFWKNITVIHCACVLLIE